MKTVPIGECERKSQRVTDQTGCVKKVIPLAPNTPHPQPCNLQFSPPERGEGSMDHDASSTSPRSRLDG
jgi:hypothetical protein